MENGTTTQSEGKDPSGFLGEIIGNPVTVKLNSGVVYKGRCQISLTPCRLHVRVEVVYLSVLSRADTLAMTGELQSVDGYMNIALEKTEEYVGGVKRRTYGDAFVRGNNGQYCLRSTDDICVSGSS
jgi:U6 snRNA-associated Sm-like protein LSm6